VLEECASGVGHGDGAGCPVEQGGAYPLLELSPMGAQGLLRDVQTGGGEVSDTGIAGLTLGGASAG